MDKKCYLEHLNIQVLDNEWICPKCGVSTQYTDEDGVEQEGWVVANSDNFDCEKLHYNDELECGACGVSMSGEEYAKWYESSKSKMVKCPHCKGTGYVKKKK